MFVDEGRLVTVMLPPEREHGGWDSLLKIGKRKQVRKERLVQN